MLNTLCDSGFQAVATSFETFIAFACFIAVAEFLRRKHPLPHRPTKVAPALTRDPTSTPSGSETVPSYPLLRVAAAPSGAYPYSTARVSISV